MFTVRSFGSQSVAVAAAHDGSAVDGILRLHMSKGFAGSAHSIEGIGPRLAPSHFSQSIVQPFENQ